MIRSVHKLMLGFMLIVALVFGGSVPAQAQEFNGFAVSKMIINSKGKSGESVKETIQVFNNTDKAAKVRVDVRDFERKDKQLGYRKDVPEALSVSKWSRVSEPEFVLEPKQSKAVDLEISISKEAEMGEYVALVGVAFAPNESTNSVTIATEILPVLYVVTTDQNGNVNLKKEWELVNFQADKVNGGKFQFQFKNTGNVHLESTGDITIRNVLTGAEEKKEIPLVNLLPKAEKELVVEWLPADYMGVYQAEVKFSLDGERFEEKSMSLFALPGKGTMIGVGAILVLAILIRWYFVRLRRKMMQEVKQQVMSEMAATEPPKIVDKD